MDLLGAGDGTVSSLTARALYRSLFAIALNVMVVGCAHPKQANTDNVVELRVFDRITTTMGAEYSQWLVASFNSQNRFYRDGAKVAKKSIAQTSIFATFAPSR